MNSDQCFKEGHLLFQSQGMLKKSWQRKYCQLYKASKQGIERLEVFENKDDRMRTAVKIITLENCVKITQMTQDVQKKDPYVFAVFTKVSVYHFASPTESEMADWISAMQAVAFKDDYSQQTIEEDNDLYCPSGEGVFSVKLVPSEASTNCGLDPGPYTLVVTPTALQLREHNSYDLLFTWPYRFIRRYGTRTGKFTFEAGRKCESGEGEFQLEHSNQQEIFRCMSSKMKNMRQLLPALGSTNSEFEGALSMLPRSRSPLLPSPTSATSAMCELDFSCSSSSQTSVQSLPRQPPPLHPKPQCKPLVLAKPIPPAKPSKPAKPPRKSLEPAHNREQAYTPGSMSLPTTPTDDYDSVVVRKEAWRTLGMEEMHHTERRTPGTQNADDYEDIDAPHDDTPTASPMPPLEQQRCPAIFSAGELRGVDPTDNYDKLEHFGTSTRLSTRSSSYHHFGKLQSASSMSRLEHGTLSKMLSDDDISTERIESCRRADDSHYGYGLVRKKSLPSETVSAPFTLSLARPNHQLCNEQEYAIVTCKPKLV
ncbi:Docking protein 2 [Frankliniella fusca]|uniref:Docking protein 2 n=1 Tax=Frankliniella fusca TaxID=407009 RepID=A0AAE1LCA8_9NEOP|nr:Docking protein 2 [Frankliniella fusca]